MRWSGFKTFHSVVSLLKNPPSKLTLFFLAYKWAPDFYIQQLCRLNLSVLAGIAVLLSASPSWKKYDLWPVGRDWREERLVLPEKSTAVHSPGWHLLTHYKRAYGFVTRPRETRVLWNSSLKVQIVWDELTEPRLNKIRSVKDWLPRSICAISIMTTARIKFKV